MPTTTPLARRIAAGFDHPLQLERGVDEYKPGTFRLQLTFRGLPKRHVEFFPAAAHGGREAAAEAANLRILELRRRRRAGELPEARAEHLTLREACDLLLEEKAGEISRKTGRPLSQGGLEWWHRILKPWREGEWATIPVDLLPASRIRRALRLRQLERPKAGADEQLGLEAALRLARREGARPTEQLLELEPPAKRQVRERRALEQAEVDLLVASAPPAYGRLIALQATVGNRIGELLLAAPKDVSLERGTLTVRGKEQRAKRIPLLEEEIDLLREQLGALRPAAEGLTAHLPSTAPGSALIWPMPDGRSWPLTAGRVAGAYFGRAVWAPAIAEAQRRWLELHPGEEETPFDGLTSHDLRSTAITAMLDLGISEETAIRRVGHADAGMVRRIYDRGDRDARALEELRERAGQGIAATRRAAARATTREAAALASKGTRA